MTLGEEKGRELAQGSTLAGRNSGKLQLNPSPQAVLLVAQMALQVVLPLCLPSLRATSDHVIAWLTGPLMHGTEFCFKSCLACYYTNLVFSCLNSYLRTCMLESCFIFSAVAQQGRSINCLSGCFYDLVTQCNRLPCLSFM